MSNKRRLLLGGLGVHLLLSLVGACQLHLPWLPPMIGHALDGYAELTGASNAYSFFAPGVGTELRPTFEVFSSDGKATRLGLEDGGSREVALRLNKIITTYWDQIRDERARRSLSASLAGKVLARHPDARAIAIRLDAYRLPDMRGYRQGERPGWELFYQAKFARHIEREVAHVTAR